VADARRLELFDDLRNLLDRAGLAGVNGDAESALASPVEESAVVGRPEVGRLGPGNVDADDASATVGDCLLGNDLVERVGPDRGTGSGQA